jgi:predicted DNA-binding protein (MmcQ/YjbR family)
MDYCWLDEFLLNHPGAHKDFKAEWQWQRYMVAGKLFAALCEDRAGRPIMSVRCDPLWNEVLRREHPGVIVPGHYCNKVHWNSALLDSDLPPELLRAMAEQSYELIFSKLPKKTQRQILGQTGEMQGEA